MEKEKKEREAGKQNTSQRSGGTSATHREQRRRHTGTATHKQSTETETARSTTERQWTRKQKSEQRMQQRTEAKHNKNSTTRPTTTRRKNPTRHKQGTQHRAEHKTHQRPQHHKTRRKTKQNTGRHNRPHGKQTTHSAKAQGTRGRRTGKSLRRQGRRKKKKPSTERPRDTKGGGRGAATTNEQPTAGQGNTKEARAHSEPRSGRPTKQTTHSAKAQGTRGRELEKARDTGAHEKKTRTERSRRKP